MLHRTHCPTPFRGTSPSRSTRSTSERGISRRPPMTTDVSSPRRILRRTLSTCQCHRSAVCRGVHHSLPNIFSLLIILFPDSGDVIVSRAAVYACASRDSMPQPGKAQRDLMSVLKDRLCCCLERGFRSRIGPEITVVGSQTSAVYLSKLSQDGTLGTHFAPTGTLFVAHMGAWLFE
jgi:hypothetical protein